MLSLMIKGVIYMKISNFQKSIYASIAIMATSAATTSQDASKSDLILNSNMEISAFQKSIMIQSTMKNEYLVPEVSNLDQTTKNKSIKKLK
jgi:hypothetical protein